LISAETNSTYSIPSREGGEGKKEKISATLPRESVGPLLAQKKGRGSVSPTRKNERKRGDSPSSRTSKERGTPRGRSWGKGEEGVFWIHPPHKKKNPPPQAATKNPPPPPNKEKKKKTPPPPPPKISTPPPPPI